MDKQISDALRHLMSSNDLLIKSRARALFNFIYENKGKIGKNANGLIDFFKKSNLKNKTRLAALVKLEAGREIGEMDLKAREFIVGFKDHLNNLITLLAVLKKSDKINISDGYFDKLIRACMVLQIEIRGSYSFNGLIKGRSRIEHLIISLVENTKVVALQISDKKYNVIRGKLVTGANIIVNMYSKFIAISDENVGIAEERLETGEILKHVA